MEAGLPHPTHLPRHPASGRHADWAVALAGTDCPGCGQRVHTLHRRLGTCPTCANAALREEVANG